MSSEDKPQLLQLSGERYIGFTINGGGTVTFVLSQISQADWLEAFAQMKVEIERQGDDEIQRNDFNAALLSLLEKKLVRAEGYTVKGGGNLCELPDWKNRIPVPHKTSAAMLLHSAWAIPSNDSEIDPSGIAISIGALWGTKDGQMLQYSGGELIHRFNPPDLKQFSRYSRAASESRLAGRKKIYASRHALLLNLYDELIVSVSGYAFADHNDASECVDVPAIKSQMDALHKVVAVRELFTGSAAE